MRNFFTRSGSSRANAHCVCPPLRTQPRHGLTRAVNTTTIQEILSSTFLSRPSSIFLQTDREWKAEQHPNGSSEANPITPLLAFQSSTALGNNSGLIYFPFAESQKQSMYQNGGCSWSNNQSQCSSTHDGIFAILIQGNEGNSLHVVVDDISSILSETAIVDTSSNNPFYDGFSKNIITWNCIKSYSADDSTQPLVEYRSWY